MNEFEQRLRQTPLRSLPPEWRQDILAAAQPPTSVPARSQPTELWWTRLLWPYPRAWAGLAAAWVVILGLHLATREPAETTTAARAEATPGPEYRAQLQQQQQMLAELLGPAEPREAARSRSTPGSPHTWRQTTLTA